MLPENTAVNRDAGASSQTSSTQLGETFVAAFIICVLVAAAALRLLSLARKPFWFDECFSVEIATLSWHDFARLLWWREANMSLYYLLLRGWLHLGFSPFYIRSLSVLASLATLPAIFWLGCKLFDRRVGMIAIALMSCNAYSIRYAQEARSYSLFLLLATLSSGFLAGCLRDPSRRNRWGYIVSSTLAVYAHFYALLLIAAQWLSVRALKGNQEFKKRPEISSALRSAWIYLGFAVFPVLAFVGKTGAGAIRWLRRPGFRDMLDYLEHLAGNDGLPLLLLYASACLAAILPVRKHLFRPREEQSVWRIQFLVIWLLFPLGLTLLLSLARPVFLGRYLIFCLPALILLAAAGLASLQKTWMMAVCLVAMLLLSLQGTLSYYDHDFDLERDGSEAAANYIYAHARPGDAILFHIAGARVPYEFFSSLRGKRNSTGGAGAGPEVIFPRHSDRLDYLDVTGNPSNEFLGSIPKRYDRVWVVLMSNDTSGSPDATTVLLNQILGKAFPRVERVQFPKLQVTLFGRE